jgi:hypothetical protein
VNARKDIACNLHPNCLLLLLLQESFFCRVLEVMADKDIALCLTPQK